MSDLFLQDVIKAKFDGVPIESLLKQRFAPTLKNVRAYYAQQHIPDILELGPEASPGGYYFVVERGAPESCKKAVDKMYPAAVGKPWNNLLLIYADGDSLVLRHHWEAPQNAPKLCELVEQQQEQSVSDEKAFDVFTSDHSISSKCDCRFCKSARRPAIQHFHSFKCDCELCKTHPVLCECSECIQSERTVSPCVWCGRLSKMLNPRPGIVGWICSSAECVQKYRSHVASNSDTVTVNFDAKLKSSLEAAGCDTTYLPDSVTVPLGLELKTKLQSVAGNTTVQEQKSKGSPLTLEDVRAYFASADRGMGIGPNDITALGPEMAPDVYPILLSNMEDWHVANVRTHSPDLPVGYNNILLVHDDMMGISHAC